MTEYVWENTCKFKHFSPTKIVKSIQNKYLYEILIPYTFYGRFLSLRFECTHQFTSAGLQYMQNTQNSFARVSNANIPKWQLQRKNLIHNSILFYTYMKTQSLTSFLNSLWIQDLPGNSLSLATYGRWLPTCLLLLKVPASEKQVLFWFGTIWIKTDSTELASVLLPVSVISYEVLM